MTLNAPRLDDREFQDLVDDAKRYVMERCEGWTDHNVSDPGVTLIEAFAWMTDLMLYRLNRVPERSYVKFLEMIGVTLRPPGSSVVEVDFRLSASLPHEVTVPAKTVVSSERTSAREPVLFTLREDATIKSATSQGVVRLLGDGSLTDWTAQLGIGRGFEAFSVVPGAGDAVYLRFDEPVDNHLLLISAECVRGEGHGIEPTRPPLRWEASTVDGWATCDLIGDDGTGGFNHNGHIEIACPPTHASVALGAEESGYWIRCVVVDSEDNRPSYQSSPRIVSLRAACIGVIASCVNAAVVEGELLGRSTGIPGQEFQMAHQPIVMMTGEHLVIEVFPEGVENEEAIEGLGATSLIWEHRDNFADSGPHDGHFTLDATSGVVRFGPEVRMEGGEVHRFGAVPPKGAFVTVRRYWFGGGESGNVSAGTIRSLRTAVPHVRIVRNRSTAMGGVDPETIDEAKVRGPLEMRSRNRAVTAEDFEYLALTAAPEVRQVKCVEDEEQPGAAAVRVLVVPDIRVESGEIDLDSLIPSPALLDRITSKLDEARLVGTRVRVEPPGYEGVSIEAVIEVRPDADPGVVQQAALAALYRYFNPVTGGESGRGWPFGRGVRAGEAYGVLQRCPGVDVVLDLSLYHFDFGTNTRELLDDGSFLLHPNELILSVNHSVTVER